MKQTLVFLTALVLALCTLLSASAAGPEKGYTLPEGLKTLPAGIGDLSLPEGLPEPVKVIGFSAADGKVYADLDREVPQLKILERNVLENAESTIFSKKNTNTAEANMFSRENAVFTVRMIWKLGDCEFVREYNTWGGYLSFSSAAVRQELDAAAFGPYTSAVRTVSFFENGNLDAETFELEGEAERFLRSVYFDREGRASSALYRWSSVNPAGYFLEVRQDAEGTLTGLVCRDGKTRFSAASQPATERLDFLNGARAQSLDPIAFNEQMYSKYPEVANVLSPDYENWDDWHEGGWDDPEIVLPEPGSADDPASPYYAVPEPATMTDLGVLPPAGAATATDLPATMTDLSAPAFRSPEPATLTDLSAPAFPVPEPATPTDLPAPAFPVPEPATLTDLPAPADIPDTVSAAPAVPDAPAAPETLEPEAPAAPEPAVLPEAEPAKGEDSGKTSPFPDKTRVWSLSFGTSFEHTVYAFVTEDPLFVIKGGKAVLNPAAKDFNGDRITVNRTLRCETPVFELPSR